MEAVIRAEGVAKAYGDVAALVDVTVAVSPGVTGLLGANGAGKTTFLGLVLGLHRPDAGRLEVLGLDPVGLGARLRERVGYSPEHHALPPDTQAYDLVTHLAEVHGLPRREALTRASDALWQVGLGEERFRPIGTMSTGQRQRVKLAAAIVHDPSLVLLDEPTEGLDPVQRDEVLALVRRIGHEFGIDVLLSSHLLEEVERVCDAVVILGEGRVQASGTLAELRGGGAGPVQAEVDDDAGAVAERLRAAGWRAVADGRRLVVDAADDGALDAVRDAVAATGLGLVRLERRTTRLEDVFLDAVPS